MEASEGGQLPRDSESAQDTKQCPYCAETIKAAAIKCRYCGESLTPARPIFQSSQRKRRPLGSSENLAAYRDKYAASDKAGFLTFFTAIVAIGVIGFMGWKAVTSWGLVPVSSGSISGTGFVSMQDGESIILRGLEVSLCRSNVTDKKSSIDKDLVTADEIASSGVDADLFSILSDRISSYVSPAVVKKTRLDINGKYNLPGLDPGSYYFFAQFPTKSGYVMWLIPIEVTTGQATTLDLHDSNATKILTVNYSIEPTTFGQLRRLESQQVATRRLRSWLEEKRNGLQDHLSQTQHSTDKAVEETGADVDFGPYMADLQRRIKQCWFPPKGNETRKVVVVFNIHKNGGLSKLRIYKSSEVADADSAALSAVQDAAPFRPLPAGSPENVEIQFSFDYNSLGTGGKGTFRAF